MDPVVLVTGSEGNIGAYVVESLHAQYPTARVIRTSRTARDSDDVVQGNLTNAQFAVSLFTSANITHVIHLAAQPYTRAGFKDHAYDLLSNDTQILLNLLAASKGIQKFVYVSSALAYENSQESPFTEDQTEYISPPSSAYGIAKWFGEKAVKQHAAQYNSTYTIWRPFNVVSPREPHDGLGRHVFVDFYRSLFVEQNPELRIFGGGNQKRCFVWVEDVANALVSHLFDKKTDDNTYNIGSTDCTTLIGLAEALLKLGKEHNLIPSTYEPKIVSGDDFYGVDTVERIPSLEKIHTELGWKASTSFRSCFEKFILAKQ